MNEMPWTTVDKISRLVSLTAGVRIIGETLSNAPKGAGENVLKRMCNGKVLERAAKLESVNDANLQTDKPSVRERLKTKCLG